MHFFFLFCIFSILLLTFTGSISGVLYNTATTLLSFTAVVFGACTNELLLVCSHEAGVVWLSEYSFVKFAWYNQSLLVMNGNTQAPGICGYYSEELCESVWCLSLSRSFTHRHCLSACWRHCACLSTLSWNNGHRLSYWSCLYQVASCCHNMHFLVVKMEKLVWRALGNLSSSISKTRLGRKYFCVHFMFLLNGRV